MAKLTSSQRKNLPEEYFGLPKERKYPMPDKEHVIMAIRYFKDCPSKQRKELAANINRIASSLGMKINVGKYSAFRPYANKEIVDESLSVIKESVSIPDDVVKVIKEAVKSDDLHRTSNQKIVSAMNIAAKTGMMNSLDKEYYLHDVSNTNAIQDMVYDTDLNIAYDVTRNFVHCKSVDDPDIIRHIGLMYNRRFLSDAIDNAQQVMRKSNIGPSVMDGLKSKLNAIPLDGDKDMIHNAMRKLQMGCTETNELSKDVAKSLAQLPGDCLGLAPSEVYNAESVADIFEKHHNVIDEMSVTAHCTIGDVMGDSLPSDWMHLIRLLAKDKMISGYYASDEHTMGMNTHNVFIRMNDWWYVLLAFHKDIQRGTGVVTGMKIYEEHRPGYILNLIAEYERTGKLPKTPIRRINIKIDKTLLDPQYALAACTEGIRVSKDGDLSFDFSITKSYMDKYSACHKVLREDIKNKNYEGMKHNCAYLFALICTIEGKFVGKDKDVDEDSKEYKDAMKARMFAINDVKSTLKIIHSHEPKFNFMKFYTDNKYDKKIYTVTHQTILGIKNLFRMIML